MGNFSEIDQAYDVHGTIPKWMRFSAAPIVRTVRRDPWLLNIPAGTLRSMHNASEELARKDRDDFSAIGDLSRWLFEHQFAPARVTDAEILEHDALRSILAQGVLPQSIQQVPLDVALGYAKEVGYVVPSVPSQPAPVAEGQSRVFAAAQYLMIRRISPVVTYLTTNFVIPDPLAKVKTAHIVQQLWIARDAYRPDGVRLLTLEVEAELAGGGDDYRRDMLLPANGYEIYRAPASWARVDPQRVVFDFLRAAEIPVLQRFALTVPGQTIKDYICAYCNGPMIRKPSGEGIVHHRAKFVHAACFNSAVNEGIYDY